LLCTVPHADSDDDADDECGCDESPGSRDVAAVLPLGRAALSDEVAQLVSAIRGYRYDEARILLRRLIDRI
jgi:hypothetical protein